MKTVIVLGTVMAVPGGSNLGTGALLSTPPVTWGAYGPTRSKNEMPAAFGSVTATL